MERKEFKAESKRLLDLMINSIYTHKEIFLRELISNASDAIDKLYYQTLSNNEAVARDDLHILIELNKEARTIKISDTGIGMSKEELEENLGTIAKSGSLAFKEELAKKEKQDEDIDVIGQFGVGFYSAFMVANKVEVVSKKYGSPLHIANCHNGNNRSACLNCYNNRIFADLTLSLYAGFFPKPEPQ